MADLILGLTNLAISSALQLDADENVEDAPNQFVAALGETLLRAANQAEATATTEERERRAAEARAAQEDRQRRAAAERRTAETNARRDNIVSNGMLRNDAAQPVKDPQPESSIDAALGDAFTSQGRSNSKPWLNLRGRDLSILEAGNAIFREEPGIVNLITVSPPASSRRAARA